MALVEISLQEALPSLLGQGEQGRRAITAAAAATAEESGGCGGGGGGERGGGGGGGQRGGGGGFDQWQGKRKREEMTFICPHFCARSCEESKKETRSLNKKGRVTFLCRRRVTFFLCARRVHFGTEEMRRKKCSPVMDEVAAFFPFFYEELRGYFLASTLLCAASALLCAALGGSAFRWFTFFFSATKERQNVIFKGTSVISQK